MAVQLIRIESLEDKRLDAYTKLTERELRCVLEPEKGIFIAESAKVIERAVDAGLEPVSFLLGERWVPQLQPFFERLEQERPELDIPAFVGSMDLMRDLTGFKYGCKRTDRCPENFLRYLRIQPSCHSFLYPGRKPDE